MMAVNFYDNHGIRFEYPADWELEETDDGPRTTLAVQSPEGLAFALLTIADDLPEPRGLVDEALAALREEYPSGLDAIPAEETIDGHRAIGHDVEFVSLDLNNFCVLRCYRTPRRTVFLLAQWSDLESEEAEDNLRVIRRSLEETDA